MSQPPFTGTRIGQRKCPSTESTVATLSVEWVGWYYRWRPVPKGESHFSAGRVRQLVMKLLMVAVIAFGTDMVCCGVDGATSWTPLHDGRRDVRHRRSESDRMMSLEDYFDIDEGDNHESDINSPDAVLGLDPTFDSPVANVTGIAGQSITLNCSIENLGKYKVAWLDVNSLPMTYEEKRIIDDSRFNLVRPNVHEWNLQVRDLRWDDRGPYRCTVNTSPIRVKLVHLHVKVPSRIDTTLSSANVTVQEGRNLTLNCSATGVPAPVITWRRQTPRTSDFMHRTRTLSAPAHLCPIGTGFTDKYIGHTLVIQNISRYCNGLYECSATNDVLQPAYHHVRVAVEFRPKVSMLNARIAQAIDRQAMVICHVTAYPQAEMKWEKDGQQLTNNARNNIDVYDVDEHTVAMTVELPRIVDDSDFGDYKCIAKNNLGSHEGITRLSKLIDTSTAMPMSTTTKPVSDHLRETGRKNIPYWNVNHSGDDLPSSSSSKTRSIDAFDTNAPSSDRVVSSSAGLGTVASPMVFWIGAALIVTATWLPTHVASTRFVTSSQSSKS